ncbi:MAG: FAD-linked oxidase C-terminal domain-containing protein, partial [Bacillota bacterium]
DYIHMYHSGLQAAGLAGMVYGHLLQNRLHTAIFCNSPQEPEKADTLIRQWAQRAVADGGKLVSENGVGRLKAGLLDALTPENIKLQSEAIQRFFAS